MSLAPFLADLRERGVRLSADGDRLRCRGPAGALTPELAAQLHRRKTEVLAFLAAARTSIAQASIVPLQPHGSKPAVFAVAGHNGDVFAYRELADALGADRPFFGLQPPGVDFRAAPIDRVERLATYFVDQITAFRPFGPRILAGYCAGGSIAFEVARQLEQRGVEVESLAMFGCPYPSAYRWLGQMDRRVRVHIRAFGRLETLAARGQYVADFVRRRTAHADPPEVEDDVVLIRRAVLERTTVAAVRRYSPRAFGGRVNLFLPSPSWAVSGYLPRRWRRAAADIHEYAGPEGCELPAMLRAPHTQVFADLFERAVNAVD